MELKKINALLKKDNIAFCENLRKKYSFTKNFEDFFSISLKEVEDEIEIKKNNIYSFLIRIRLVGFWKAYNDISGKNKLLYV